MCTCEIYRYEYAYTSRRKEFQNILERKLCNCFEQMLLIQEKNVEHGIKYDIDSSLHTLDISELYKRFDEYLVI